MIPCSLFFHMIHIVLYWSLNEVQIVIHLKMAPNKEICVVVFWGLIDKYVLLILNHVHGNVYKDLIFYLNIDNGLRRKP